MSEQLDHEGEGEHLGPVIGRVGFAEDLKQFYTSMALDPSQWNLQRVLWREGMDMSAEVEEIVILSLIFGVRAVSALSEWALKLLADYVRSRSPRLAELLERSRFVDDLGDSDESLEAVKKLIAKADELFESVGLQCKGWSISGSNPHPDVTKDEISIDVAGMEWCPAIDTVSVKIPPLHFGKKSRGKLRVGTEVFDGSFEDLEKFVPQKLTRRMAVSKFAALFDMLGHLTPETAKMKLNVSDATKETDAWDDAVPPELRQKIVKDLWRLFKLQGLKFRRAVIPDDAVNLKAHLTACVDAAKKTQNCWSLGEILEEMWEVFFAASHWKVIAFKRRNHSQGRARSHDHWIQLACCLSESTGRLA